MHRPTHYFPEHPRYLPEDPDGCWAWKDLAVCSERAMPDHPMKGGHHGLEARSGPHPGLRCGPGEALLQRAGWLRRRSRHPDRRRDAPRPADSAWLGLLDPPERRDPEHAAGSARGLAARRLRHRGCPGRTVRAGREGWPGCTQGRWRVGGGTRRALELLRLFQRSGWQWMGPAGASCRRVVDCCTDSTIADRGNANFGEFPFRDCMKRSQIRASRLVMRRIMAAYTNASPLAHDLSSSLLILLCCSIQAIVRSTTHLLGSTTKPLGGNSFCQSTATPSLAHSFVHLINTSSGAGFLWDARDELGAPAQRLLSAQSLPLSSPRGSLRLSTDDAGEESAHPPCAVAS